MHLGKTTIFLPRGNRDGQKANAGHHCGRGMGGTLFGRNNLTAHTSAREHVKNLVRPLVEVVVRLAIRQVVHQYYSCSARM
jgi:hypothetical protein